MEKLKEERPEEYALLYELYFKHTSLHTLSRTLHTSLHSPLPQASDPCTHQKSYRKHSETNLEIIAIFSEKEV